MFLCFRSTRFAFFWFGARRTRLITCIAHCFHYIQRVDDLGLYIYIYSDVCTKYREASSIVDLALAQLIPKCVVGATVLELCKVRKRDR